MSGGDLKELASIRTEADAQAMALTMRTLLDRLASLPVPVVGALNGHAFGGGCEVAMDCDLRLAAGDVKLAFNQVDLGIMPAWGGIERLQAVVGRGRALYLLTTGLPIDAPTAADWGPVERVVPRAEFDDRLVELVSPGVVGFGGWEGVHRVGGHRRDPQRDLAGFTQEVLDRWPLTSLPFLSFSTRFAPVVTWISCGRRCRWCSRR